MPDTSFDPAWQTAAEIAAAVTSGETSAQEVVSHTLARIRKIDGKLGAFTAVLDKRAQSRAEALDRARTNGEPMGPLAGVPFAVKNLFDIAGIPTLAGSKVNRTDPPATRDQPLIERLEAAGAVLIGALNMGEYAYDFTGENINYGHARNPHDLERMTGGSSGGSAAAVAGGEIAFSLGSDTNGSIRVPASLCGLFGLKPTYGRLPRNRSFPFVDSLDHLGPFARSARDLALTYDAMQGYDAGDAACVNRPPEPTLEHLDRGIGGLRIATAGGYFREAAFPEVLQALDNVASALDARRTVEIPEASRARSAAFVISATEGASLHRERLRTRAADYDPAVRDRLIAAAMVPAAAIVKAQKFRRWYRDEVLKLFAGADAILAPATPCAAPKIGQQTFNLGGSELSVRANLGLYTQPISFIGLPVVAVPVALSPLPVGVQIICAPWREDVALRIAWELERSGVARAPRPHL